MGQEGLARANRAITAIAVTIALLSFCGGIATCVTACRDKVRGLWYAICCTFWFQLAFIITVTVLSRRGLGQMSRKLQSLQDLAVVNGCSDDYTVVPVEEIGTDFREAEGYQDGITLLALIMLIGVSVVGSCLGCALCYSWKKKKGR